MIEKIDFLTPSDIARVKFSVSFRGYKIEEVDEFIEQIELSYTKLWKENMELKNRVEFLLKELETYKKMENIINESVITSKKLAEDIKVRAQNESEAIINKAIKEAEELKDKCKKEINQIMDEINKLHQIRNMLVSETKNYLNLILDKINYMEKMFSSHDNSFLSFYLPSLAPMNEEK